MSVCYWIEWNYKLIFGKKKKKGDKTAKEKEVFQAELFLCTENVEWLS